MNARTLNHEELRDEAIATAARFQVAAIRTAITNGNAQVLHDLGNDLGGRLSAPGVSGHLIRTALACGPLLAGQMLTDLIQKCIDADAEIEAIKGIEQVEAEGRADRLDRRLSGALNYMMA